MINLFFFSTRIKKLVELYFLVKASLYSIHHLCAGNPEDVVRRPSSCRHRLALYRVKLHLLQPQTITYLSATWTVQIHDLSLSPSKADYWNVAQTMVSSHPGSVRYHASYSAAAVNRCAWPSARLCAGPKRKAESERISWFL
jgi:hypothetical protein